VIPEGKTKMKNKKLFNHYKKLDEKYDCVFHRDDDYTYFDLGDRILLDFMFIIYPLYITIRKIIIKIYDFLILKE
jgi:hypothetical protein